MVSGGQCSDPVHVFTWSFALAQSVFVWFLCFPFLHSFTCGLPASHRARRGAGGRGGRSHPVLWLTLCGSRDGRDGHPRVECQHCTECQCTECQNYFCVVCEMTATAFSLLLIEASWSRCSWLRSGSGRSRSGRSRSIGSAHLGPETAGRPSVLGNNKDKIH